MKQTGMRNPHSKTGMTQQGRSSQAIAVAFVAIALAFLLYITWLTVVDLERMKAEALNEVAITTVALQEHTARTFGEVDLVLSGLAALCTDGVQPDARRHQQQWADQMVGLLPQLAFVALQAPDGRLLFTSGEGADALLDGLHAAPRTSDPTAGNWQHHIGMPYHHPHSGQRIIPLSRLLPDAAGEPCAMAIAGIDADKLEAFFRQALGKRDGVALLRRLPSGILLRVPEPPEPVLHTHGTGTSGASGVQRVVSPIDGKIRLAGYRSLERFPLGVRFALTEEAVVSQWRQHTLQSMTPAIGVLLLLLGAALWIDWLLRRGRQREQHLAILNTDLDRAHHEAAEANLAKDRFLANMSHEVRTPLNTIVGIGELLQQTSLNTRQQDYARKLKLASSNLLTLVNSVLDFSRAASGRIELEQTRFDLAALLHEVVEQASLSAEQKGLPVVLTRDPALPTWLIGDPLRLRQILLNLLGNAIKFTEHGRVELRADVLNKNSEACTLRLSVIDSGIGIPQEQHREIFALFTQADPSTTRRYGGTGLGLTISQRIAHAMGSEITVQSRLGEGSTFALVLKLPRASADGEAAAATIPGNLNGLHLLLVDDDPLGRTIERDRLEAIGATISVAEHGAEALAAWLAGTRWDGILMDIQTPEMDGLEATRRIRAAGGRMPIIGLTANNQREERGRALAAGMDDCLGKPTEITQLAATIRRYLPTSRTEGTP